VVPFPRANQAVWLNKLLPSEVTANGRPASDRAPARDIHKDWCSLFVQGLAICNMQCVLVSLSTKVPPLCQDP